MARCAYDHERLVAAATTEMSGFSVHIDASQQPVKPAHEVIEGRLLTVDGKLATLKLATPLPPAMAIVR